MQNIKKHFFTVFILFIFLLIVLIFYRETFIYHINEATNSGYISYEKAKVISLSEENIQRDEATSLLVGSQKLKLEIITGEYKGEIIDVTNTISPYLNVITNQGDTIIVEVSTSNSGSYNVFVFSYNRAPYLIAFVCIFFGLLWLVGGKKGLMSVIGLVFSFICILFLFIPMLYRGYSPIWSSILVAIISTCITLYLLNGWSSKTLSAILGTVCGVVTSGLLSWIMGWLTQLSGFNMNNFETLIIISQNTGMQLKHLLFSSILISSLGAVMDLAVSVASAVQEVYDTNNSLTKYQLCKSGINVGRDMMGTMANTLILAFAGSSISLIIILFSYNIPISQLMNMNILGIELIQGLAGSMAVVLTVPMVSFISSMLINGNAKEKVQ